MFFIYHDDNDQPCLWSHSLTSRPADLEEQLEVEAVHQQEAVSVRQEAEAAFQQETFQQETFSSRKCSEDFPSELPDSMTLPPPEWPDSPLEDNIPAAE